MQNYSYVTLLTDDSYVSGVMLLNATLKETNSKYPLLTLVTNEVSPPCLEILNQFNIKYKLVDTISVTDYIYEHNTQINPRLAGTWKNCWTKFHIYDQTEYDKIVFLDADVMVLKNLDNLFDKPHMTSALDGEYFNIWPGWDHFNSGVLVIEPSHKLFENILQFAQSFPKAALPNYAVADQEILNFYYKDWPDQKELHLSKYYDIFPPYVLTEHLEDLKDNCYFVHYVGRKPWASFIKLPEETYDEYYYDMGKQKVEELYTQLDWTKIYDKVKVTIYAICKNEVKYINKWLECFSKADYVCVLDTGSSDGTWEILQRQKKVFPNLIIQQKAITPWRYDTARNESMKLIPSNTVMFFMMDLDEIIKEDDWVEKVRHAWTPNFTRGVYTYHRDITPEGVIQKTMQEYRIHSRKWHKWVNVVHEALVNENNEKYFFEFECTPIDITVWHYADHQPKEHDYAQLCEQELEEHPDNTLMRLQLAIEYEIQDKNELAAQHFEYLIQNRDFVLQNFELARCYYGLGRYNFMIQDYDMANFYFAEGRVVAPYYADNYIGAAEVLEAQNADHNIIYLLETGLSLCQNIFWCSVCNIGFWYTFYLLGKSYFNIGEHMKGFGYMCLAESLDPSNQTILNIKNKMLDFFSGKLNSDNEKEKQESN